MSAERAQTDGDLVDRMLSTGGRQRPTRVVVGVDGSPGSRAALVYAFAASARRGAALEVVATYSVQAVWVGGYPLTAPAVSSIRDDLEARVTALVHEVRGDPAVVAVPGSEAVRTLVVVSVGPAARRLVDASTAADLLVVGSRGRGTVRSMLLGSVALHCVTHAHCPVVVVHPVPADRPQHTVVVGVDGSAASRAALLAGLAEAARLGTDVAAVTTLEGGDGWIDPAAVAVPSPDWARREATAGLEAMVEDTVAEHRAGHGGRAPAARAVIAEGPAVDVLIREAADARLLVVGSRGTGAFRGLLLGSVALACAMHGTGPVLVVHPRPEPVEAPVPAPATADRPPIEAPGGQGSPAGAT